MGDALRAWLIQPVIDFFTPESPQSARPPMVGGYVVDYDPVSGDDIAAPTPHDDLLKTGNWIPVNRRV